MSKTTFILAGGNDRGPKDYGKRLGLKGTITPLPEGEFVVIEKELG